MVVTKPKYYLLTFGCQMNKNDSERLESLLKGLGFDSTDVPEQADIILLNTCSVRQQAEDKVFGKVREFQKIKESNPKLIIGITGCMAGRDKDGAIKKKMSAVDLYFPTSDMGQLPRWIGELRPELVNSTDLIEDYMKINPERKSFRQAFVSIQTGCNKFCSYCVVPFARGLEKNRPVKDILDEIKDLAAHGCVDITLLGQTINSYCAPDVENFSTRNPYKDNFAALLWEVNQISEIKRLHFTAPHPNHMTNEVIAAMTLPAHINFIHLPVQSGDDEVLRRMNRRHTVDQFKDVVRRLREKIPSIAIGTDIIVGFCGETKEQFQKTIDLYKEIGFDIGYIARYSERSGTAAKRAFKDDVSIPEKKQRWDELQHVMEEVVYKKNQKYVEEIVEVFVERHEPPKITDELLRLPEDIRNRIMLQTGMCFGNSREMKLVSFPGTEDMIGEIVSVKIEKAETWILEGKRL